MPGDGAIVFGDLIGKLDMLRIECATQGVIQAPRLEPANLDALNTEMAFPRLSANRTYVGHRGIDTNDPSRTSGLISVGGRMCAIFHWPRDRVVLGLRHCTRRGP
jgi:hypothetical protein